MFSSEAAQPKQQTPLAGALTADRAGGRALSHRARMHILLVVATLSIGSTVWGLQMLWRYEYTAGPAPVGGSWPAAAAILRDPDRLTLVTFLHPQCTCSQATLHELALTLQTAAHPPRAYAFVLHPAGAPDGWVRSTLWQAAADIPNLEVIDDRDGREAARFGAQVSGDTMLFAPDGRLLFAGGITRSRGHIGANGGAEALSALLGEGPVPSRRSPVFGCLLGVDNPRALE